jgi:rubrerythrin
MIVINSNNKDSTDTKHEMMHNESLEDMFRKELDAYCVYKDWAEETTDPVFEMALEEIMIDEYLHAKFLRDYMIDKDMYSLTDADPHEKKFWRIHKKLFKE